MLWSLEGVNPHRELLLEVSAPSAAEALRRLLAEALYHFETEGFIGAAAAVEIDPAGGAAEAALPAEAQDAGITGHAGEGVCVRRESRQGGP